MTKIYTLIIVFLACGWGYSQYNKLMLENKNTSLETKNSALEKVVLDYESQISFWEKEVEKRNQEKILLSERNAELEKEAEKDKAYFDWSADISNSAVIKRLQAD